jgi:uroporphyrinogen-III synthase
VAGRLEGRRILVLRPEGQAESLARALRAEGAEPVTVPAIRILPPSDWGTIEAALGRPHGWTAFTSVNGVGALGGRLTTAALGLVAAIGPATAEALASQGVDVAFVPSAFTTEALGRELPSPPTTVCLVRADIAGGDLEQILADRGFSVDRVDAYRTEPTDPALIAAALAVGVDAVALTSASITRSFAAAASSGLNGAVLFSIGPATSAACRDAGLALAAEASPHTISGLVDALAAGLGHAGAGTPPDPQEGWEAGSPAKMDV